MRPPIDLTKKKPRETSGARSANRFTFQINWAFWKLIQLQKAGNDYLIVLDLHDDVVVADSATAPRKADFYQVKTSKKKPWSAARLLYRSKSSNSILGKLYHHRLNFPKNHGDLAFVSDRDCGLDMPAKYRGKPELLFAKLDPTCKTRLIAALRKEHKLPADPDCDNCIKFVISNLDVDEHRRDVRGALVEYFNERATGVTYPINGFYVTVADILRQKNDREESPESMPELIARKAITKTEVEHILAHMMPIDRYKQIWSGFAGADFGPDNGVFQKDAIRREFSRYAADKQNPRNKVAEKVTEGVLAAIAAVRKNPQNVNTVGDLLQHTLPLVKNVPSSVDTNYLKGAILLEFHDDDNSQLPPADPKPAGEAA